MNLMNGVFAHFETIIKLCVLTTYYLAWHFYQKCYYKQVDTSLGGHDVMSND